MEWVINIPIIYIQVAILLVSMVSIAQAGGVVSISDVALDPGDNTTIPITIYGATGVAAVGLNLSYDPCVVNIIDTHQGDFTGFFGFDNRNVTDGWTRINTHIMHRDLTGDLRVAYVTLEAVGKGGDVSPLNIEILAMADQNGTNIPRTARNGTFRVLAPATAPTSTTIPAHASTSISIHPASDSSLVPAPVDKPATEQMDQPPKRKMPTKPSTGTTLHSVPGFNASLGLIGLAIVCLLMRR